MASRETGADRVVLRRFILARSGNLWPHAPQTARWFSRPSSGLCFGRTFEIYGELLGRAETGHIDTANLMGQFYPQVEESTDLALAFDEHCAQTANANLESLQQRLSELGEVMEARFSVEDKLISLVRGVDQILAA